MDNINYFEKQLLTINLELDENDELTKQLKQQLNTVVIDRVGILKRYTNMVDMIINERRKENEKKQIIVGTLKSI